MFFNFPSFSQCLTVHDKIIPDKHISLNNRFAGAVSIHGDYLAVGDYLHDSLSYNGGMVLLYQRKGENWRQIATFFPSDPTDEGWFGQSIELTENYLFVSSPQTPHIYIYLRREVNGAVVQKTVK
ncbi:hypothetical protein OKW21_000228 [Catalinimonas alkaloidigena]|uniref:hypothetical protein n=1 Tax=Catalinimonas alkaloidigena TaxID=1075417 RepID=UPI00240563BB|nr:hypothetical protein [Catalinimonas alkaloidigena]MDF9794965.1 hypothetical protein [Catalinimonas alkaloidigena]